MSEPEEPKPIAGYVRCGVTFVEARWRFEVIDETTPIAIVDIETADGLISVGLNRQDAEGLLRTLQLFLADWPNDRESS